jgi:4-diphosphocytidyl-2-C-methyl-D-erythritol kinase
MNLRQNEQQRTRHAPAKLNLFLEVLDRRDDGYHELETLMVPINLRDSLTISPLPSADATPGRIEFSLRSADPTANIPTDANVPADASNLVVRALKLLQQRSGCEQGARIELVKRIPSEAGLGGGSSDAATALELGNEFWRLGYPREKLAEFAAELGSDVPFFLAHGAAICRGRGERVERLAPTVPLHVVLVKPPAALSTADVFRASDLDAHHNSNRTTQSAAAVTALAAALTRGTPTQLHRWMTNRLEAAAAALSPWVARLRDSFAKLDCLAHQLTGSGSVYFGICRHAQHARRLATILTTQQLGTVYTAQTCP